MSFILFLLVVVILILILIKFRRPKQNTLLLYSGSNGSGKTFNMTENACKLYRKSLREWKKINKPILRKPLDLIPYFKNKRLNHEYYGLRKPILYSTYPIEYKKGCFSTDLNNAIMFLETSIPINSIVVIDEFSGWISQFEYKENFSNTLNDHLQKWRHYHGNHSHLLMADQCTNNIPIQARYRVNTAIVCMETKHYLKFLHITKYKNIELTDDIKNIEIVDEEKSDTDDKNLRVVNLSFRRKYDDRAYSNRYYYVDKNGKHSKYIKSKKKVNFTLLKPDTKKTYVNLDNVIKQDNEKNENK